MTVIKISIFVIVTVILAIQLKGVKSEYSLYLVLTGAVLIAAYGVSSIVSAMQMLKNLEQYLSNAGDYISLIVKMIGITYVCEITSGICRDAGYLSLGSQVELFGKICILICGLPIMLALLQTLQEFS